MAAGDTRLAVAKAGWTPVRDDLNETRDGQPGTHSLPEEASTSEETA